MGRHRSRAWQGFALYLGLVALIVQMLAPLCMAGAGGDGPASSIIICTPHGLETVTIGADGQPLTGAPAGQHAGCVFCVTCHAGNAFAAPPSMAALPLLDFTRAPMASAEAPATLSRPYASYVTRGPPGLAFSRQA